MRTSDALQRAADAAADAARDAREAQKQMLIKVCTGKAPWQINSTEGVTA